MNHAWSYITAAFGVSGIGLVALIALSVLRLAKWSRRAREEDKP